MHERSVIDDRDIDPATDSPEPTGAARPIGPEMLPPWLRPLLLLAVLESIALGVFLLAASPRDAEKVAVAALAAPSYATDLGAVSAPSARSPIEALPIGAGAPTDSPPPDRITKTGGAYVVELNGADATQALTMLSEATHATVRGGELLARSPQRLTRSLVAHSPQEAWQAVFGDLASFVAHCSASSCAVRFVSVGDPSAAIEPIAPPAAPPVTPIDAGAAPPPDTGSEAVPASDPPVP